MKNSKMKNSRVCMNCKKKFLTFDFAITRKFCSRKCYGEYYGIFKTGNKVETIFDAVGKEAITGKHEPWEPEKQCEPTDAFPGTLEKIQILRSRLENGEELWSDRDRYRYEGKKSNYLEALREAIRWQ